MRSHSGPKKRRRPTTSRGPQGLPTQAASRQRPQRPRPKAAPRRVRRTGVFARPLEAPVRQVRRQQAEKRQRAQRRAPGQDQRVQRQVVPKDLTAAQRRGLVRAQQKRLGIRTPADAERAGFDRRRGDRETRAALNQLAGARKTEIRGERRGMARQPVAIRAERNPPQRVAGVQLSDISRHLKRGQGAAAMKFVGGPGAKVVKNAAKDVLLFPVNAVKGVYEIGAAANESAQKAVPALEGVLPGKGSHKRSKQVLKGATEGALAQAIRAGANAAQGDSKAAKKHARLAAKAAVEHPVYSALDVSGAYAVVGRSSGAAMRRGAAGERGKRAASTRRAPLRVSGTNIEVPQSYSKNVLTARRQKRKERERADQAYARLREQGVPEREAKRRAVAEAFEAQPSRRRDFASGITGGAVRGGREGLIRRYEDERVAQTESRRRVGREETRKAVRRAGGAQREALPEGPGAKGTVKGAVQNAAFKTQAGLSPSQRRGRRQRRALVAGTRRDRARRAVSPGAARKAAATPEQAIVRLAATKEVGDEKTLVADLQRIKARLDDVYENEFGKLSLKGDAAKQNRATAGAIEKYLSERHTPERAKALVETGRKVRELAQGNTRALRELNALEADQALAAAIRPAAVSRMGARFDETKVDAPEQARVYAEKKAAESSARSGLRSAKAQRRRAGQARARAERKAAKEEGRARLLDERGRARQGRKGTALERQAAELDRRADDMEARGLALRNGARRQLKDELAPKRAYRQRGTRPGSNRDLYARALIDEGEKLRQKAKEMRGEAVSLPSPRTQAFVKRLGERAEDSRARIAELERQIDDGFDESVPDAAFKLRQLTSERDRTTSTLRKLEQAQKAVETRLARREGETAPAALARLEKAQAGVQVAGRRAAAAEAGVFPARNAAKNARQERVAAKPVKVERGLIGPDGGKITTEAAVARLADDGLLSPSTVRAVQEWRAAGSPDRLAPESEMLRRVALEDPELPGFLTARPQARGAAAYFVNSFGTSRKKADGGSTNQRLTGESTRQGSVPMDLRAVEEALVQQRGLIDALYAYDDFIGRWGQRKDNGRAFTPDEAEAEMDMRRAAGETYTRKGEEVSRWVPLRVAPTDYVQSRIDTVMEKQNPGMLNPLDEVDARFRAAADMVKARREGKANVVLVDRQAFERFEDHQKKQAAVEGQVMQKLTSAFRGTVLSVSAKWLTGNVLEAALRSATAGVTPVDYFRGRKVIAALMALDEQRGREFVIRATGGLIFGSSERLSVFRDRSALDGTSMAPVGAALGGAARMPLVKQALDGVDAYQRLVFGANRGIERAFQQAAVGKIARQEVRELTDGWYGAVRLHREAFEDVAKGLLGTDRQVKFAFEVDRILGKYGRFSPSTRRIVQTIAPFLPWYLNAARFVYHTLPAEHPIKTALLATVERTFEQQFEEERESLPPGSLGAALVRKDGGLVDMARYTPFSAFTNLPEGVVDPILPQFSSVYGILQGRSFTNRELDQPGREKVSREQRAALAFYSFMESITPGLMVARRVREKGETAYDTSMLWDVETKPGSSQGEPGFGAAANRILNPFRPTYLKGGPRSSGGAQGAAAPAREPAASPQEEALERFYEQQDAAVGSRGPAVEQALDDYYEKLGR